MTSQKGISIKSGEVEEALDWFQESPKGSHCLIVYPDLITLRKIYAQYTKILLENNAIVLILPYYETTEMVRLTLSGANPYNGNNNYPLGYSGIDVNKYEKDGSLKIIDSVKGYFPSEAQKGYVGSEDILNGGLDFKSFLELLSKHSEKRRNSGVTVLSDLGSFHHFHYPDSEKLIQYESSLPKQFDIKNLNCFCFYHLDDFRTRFGQERQMALLNCHTTNMVLTSISSN